MEIPTFSFCPFNTPNMKGCHAPKSFNCPIAYDSPINQMHLCNMVEGEFEAMMEAIKGEMMEELENGE